MTIGLAINIPDQGCVLGCDGRLLSNYDIFVDDCKKFALCGSVAVLVAGQDGSLLESIEKAKRWDQIAKRAGTYASEHPDQRWELLAFDRVRQRLVTLDSDGCRVDVGAHSFAIGAGAPFVAGALAVLPPAKTLEAAEKLVVDMMHLAMKRSAACGGKLTVIVAKRGEKYKVK